MEVSYYTRQIKNTMPLTPQLPQIPGKTLVQKKSQSPIKFELRLNNTAATTTKSPQFSCKRSLSISNGIYNLINSCDILLLVNQQIYNTSSISLSPKKSNICKDINIAPSLDILSQTPLNLSRRVSHQVTSGEKRIKNLLEIEDFDDTTSSKTPLKRKFSTPLLNLDISAKIVKCKEDLSLSQSKTMIPIRLIKVQDLSPKANIITVSQSLNIKSPKKFRHGIDPKTGKHEFRHLIFNPEISNHILQKHIFVTYQGVKFTLRKLKSFQYFSIKHRQITLDQQESIS